MNQRAIDTVTRAVAGLSRRSALFLLAGIGPSLVAAQLPNIASAKKKRRKRKPKQPKPNAFGCLEVNDACTSAEQCCSGLCEGKQGKRTCRAHDTGTCRQEGQLVPCNNRTDCGCFRTTAGSDVCAGLAASSCAECRRDVDCLALGFPAGSACAPGPCESGMACMAPCGTVIAGA